MSVTDKILLVTSVAFALGGILSLVLKIFRARSYNLSARSSLKLKVGSAKTIELKSWSDPTLNDQDVKNLRKAIDALLKLQKSGF
jgi:hypothetical protein